MSELSGSISLLAKFTEVLEDDATRTRAQPVTIDPGKVTEYTDGDLANQVELMFYREFVATGAPEVYDLSSIVCVDGTVGMDYVREVVVHHDGTDAAKILTHGGGTTPFNPEQGGTSPTQTIQAGTAKRLVSKPLGATGHAVGSNVNVSLDPGADTIPGKILILGHN
jgi:hypothetical protein